MVDMNRESLIALRWSIGAHESWISYYEECIAKKSLLSPQLRVSPLIGQVMIAEVALWTPRLCPGQRIRGRRRGKGSKVGR